MFERAPAAHPDCTPPAGRLIVGDFLDTLPGVRLPAPAALVHADIGTGDKAASLALAQPPSRPSSPA